MSKPSTEVVINSQWWDTVPDQAQVVATHEIVPAGTYLFQFGNVIQYKTIEKIPENAVAGGNWLLVELKVIKTPATEPQAEGKTISYLFGDTQYLKAGTVDQFYYRADFTQIQQLFADIGQQTWPTLESFYLAKVFGKMATGTLTWNKRKDRFYSNIQWKVLPRAPQTPAKPETPPTEPNQNNPASAFFS